MKQIVLMILLVGSAIAQTTHVFCPTDGACNWTGTQTFNNIVVNGTCTGAGCAGGGSGTVTSFSAGTLSPLFTTSVATSTSTPALTFSLSNFSADSIFGNFTSGSAAPSTQAIPACAADGTHALTYASHTLGCTAVSGGGSGTVNSGALHAISYYASAGTAVSGDAATSLDGSGNATFATVTTTGGGQLIFNVNASPAVTTSKFSLFGPSTTPTAYGLQFSATAPTAGMVPVIGTCASSVCQVNYTTAPTSLTRTWQYTVRGTAQGAVGGAALYLPAANAPTFVCGTTAGASCDATHTQAEWQIPATTTSNTFGMSFTVPTGHTGAYTIRTVGRSADTAHSATLEIWSNCVAAGSNPDTGFSSASDSTVGITFTPSGSASANVVSSGSFTPTCADGNVLYILIKTPANTLTSPLNFSELSAAIQASL